MAVEHYENFPVASVLCPPSLRPAVVAIYHYARTADDVADEGDAPAAQRLADLEAYRNELHAVAAAQPAGERWRHVFEPLARSMRQFELPLRPLEDLLDAFAQDATNPHYTTRADVLDYCRRSADPIGRLLLHLYGIGDAQSLRRSDAICTALQLINFWQDLSVDGPRGRQYVADEDLHAHGVSRDELARCEDSPRARAMVRELCGWARTLMHTGAPLALQVPGRAGWELRLVVQGGLRIVEKIEAMDHAALTWRPRLTALDVPLLLWRALRMRAS